MPPNTTRGGGRTRHPSVCDCRAGVATSAGVDWWSSGWTSSAVRRADAWRVCATRIDGALSTRAEWSAAARLPERIASRVVGLSGCRRVVGLSGCRVVGLSGCRVVGLSGALALAGNWGGWRQSPCADECSRPSTLVQAIFGDEKQIADVVREQLRRVWVPTRTRCVEPMKSSRLARRQANDPNQTAGQHGSAVRLVRQTAVHREGRTAECW